MAEWLRDQRADVEQSFQEMIELFQTGKREVKFTWFRAPIVEYPWRIEDKAETHASGNKFITVNVVQKIDEVTHGVVTKYTKKRISSNSYGMPSKADRFETWFTVQETHYDDRPYSSNSWVTEHKLVFDHETELWYIVLKDEKFRRGADR